MMKENKMTVSPLFVDIYNKFNVLTQVEKMKELSKKELYLLLTLCWDKFDETDPVVRENFANFKDESLELFDLFDDKEIANSILIELGEETGDKYIDIDLIVDPYGMSLPDPLTKEEIRDLKINLISK